MIDDGGAVALDGQVLRVLENDGTVRLGFFSHAIGASVAEAQRRGSDGIGEGSRRRAQSGTVVMNAISDRPEILDTKAGLGEEAGGDDHDYCRHHCRKQTGRPVGSHRRQGAASEPRIFWRYRVTECSLRSIPIRSKRGYASF